MNVLLLQLCSVCPLWAVEDLWVLPVYFFFFLFCLMLGNNFRCSEMLCELLLRPSFLHRTSFRKRKQL